MASVAGLSGCWQHAVVQSLDSIIVHVFVKLQACLLLQNGGGAAATPPAVGSPEAPELLLEDDDDEDGEHLFFLGGGGGGGTPACSPLTIQPSSSYDDVDVEQLVKVSSC